MDKIRFLLVACLLAVLQPGCVGDVINEAPERVPGQNGDIDFEIGFAPRTRVSTGADFRSAWEDGDEIGVYAVAHGAALASSDNYIHNAKLTYSSADGGSWTQETPLYWPMTASGISALDFYAYYPYDAGAADPTAITFNVKADQSAAADYSASDLLTAKSDNNGDGWAKGSTVGLTFSHALSMVQLTIDDAVGALDVNEDITVTLRSVLTDCGLNLGTPEVVTAADGDAVNITMYRVEQPDDADYNDVFTFRALVPAQTLAEGANLFRIANGEQMFNGSALPADLIMAAGQAETFTQVMPLSAVIQSEANCYMVRPGGRSLLIPVSQANRVLTADGLGAATTGLGGVTADNFTVELVWGDTPVGSGGVLAEIGAKQYSGKGYVYVKPGVAGNAVVAIRDKDSGSIKWSWHIWVTEPVGSGTDTNPASGVTWMDRNLGAGGAGSYQAGGKNGLFYQWGRKDAFPASDGTYNNQTYYIGDATTGTTANPPTGSYTELPQLVQNPLAFATNESTYRGSLNVGEGNKSWSDDGAKTIYDPCPAGWRVSENGKWSSSSDYISGSNDEWAAFANNGRMFNGVGGTANFGHFYPASGCRYSASGALIAVGSNGTYWSATPSSAANARNLNFSSGAVYPQGTAYRAYGFAVRCVAE